jgi:hypothetical protein
VTAPTLFDEMPKARLSDPQTSHEAAERVQRSSRELTDAIRWWLAKQGGPRTAFEIGDAIAGYRWSHASVRSGVSRAGLRVVDENGRSPRGQKARRYSL